MSLRIFLLSLTNRNIKNVPMYRTLFILFACTVWLPLAQAAPPNIILIFVDDMGYGDLGCYGNTEIKTPNIDRLAAEGQRWTSFYASGSVCVPSRRGLMSGRHPAIMKRGALTTTRDKLLPAMLKKRGYATAILGKWHLAGYPKDFGASPMHPLACGFDYHFGTPGSNDVPAPPGKRQTRTVFDTCTSTDFPVPLFRGREKIEQPLEQTTITRRYTEEAVRWIDQNKGNRFFLYLAHNMPHAPVFASKAFQGKSAGGTYGDVIEEIDWSVGEVMRAVKEHEIDEQTLIVFTSDNGPWTMFGPHGGTAGPLRGEKGTSWEGGFRVPGIFRWPGSIEPGEIGDMAANLDLYATFAALAGGAELPTDLPGFISKDLSGVLLRGEKSPRRQWWFSGNAEAFRSGDYKIHLTTKSRSSNPDTRAREPAEKHDPPLLFDVSKDIGEQHNINAQHPEKVEELLKTLKRFKTGE